MRDVIDKMDKVFHFRCILERSLTKRVDPESNRQLRVGHAKIERSFSPQFTKELLTTGSSVFFQDLKERWGCDLSDATGRPW